MNKLNFTRGAVVALVLALAATALLSIQLLLAWPSLLAITCLVFGGYLMVLLRHSKRRAGRLLAALVWFGITLASAALLGLSFGFLGIQAAMLWLLRSWLFHRTPAAIALDGCIGLLAIGAALFAMQQSGSIGLSIWSYFLVQSSFSWITSPLRRADAATAIDDRFDQANRQAEAALHRLMTKSSNPAGSKFSDMDLSSRKFGDY